MISLRPLRLYEGPWRAGFGVQKRLTECGQWFATAPEDELQRFFATEPGLLRDWDDEYGDRMDKLVFIGRGMDRAAITAALDACLA